MDYYINLPTELKAIIKSFMPSHIIHEYINRYNKKLNNDPKKINFIEDGEIFYRKIYNKPFYTYICKDSQFCIKKGHFNYQKWFYLYEKYNCSNEYMIKDLLKIRKAFNKTLKSIGGEVYNEDKYFKESIIIHISRSDISKKEREQNKLISQRGHCLVKY